MSDLHEACQNVKNQSQVVEKEYNVKAMQLQEGDIIKSVSYSGTVTSVEEIDDFDLKVEVQQMKQTRQHTIPRLQELVVARFDDEGELVEK